MAFFMLCAWYGDWYQHDISCPPGAAVPYKEVPLTEPNAGIWMEICSWRGNGWSDTIPIGNLITIITRSLLKRDFVITLLWFCLHFPSFHLSCVSHITTLGTLRSFCQAHNYPLVYGQRVHSTAHLAGNPRSCCYVDKQPSSHRQAGWGFPSLSDLLRKDLYCKSHSYSLSPT